MATWIEVADSAVKIGLGALVGGGFALWQGRRTRLEERRKADLALKRDHLQSATDVIDKFSLALSDYWATVTNILHIIRSGSTVDPQDLQRFTTCDSALYAAFNDLHLAESRLLLLGLGGLQESLRQYAAHAEIFFKKSHPDTTSLSEAELMALYQSFRDERRSLLLEVGKAYEVTA